MSSGQHRRRHAAKLRGVERFDTRLRVADRRQSVQDSRRKTVRSGHGFFVAVVGVIGLNRHTAVGGNGFDVDGAAEGGVR